MKTILAVLLLSAFAAFADDDLQKQTQASFQRACALYPSLRVEGSELRKSFFKQVDFLAAVDQKLLQDPKWPEKMARIHANALGIQPAQPAPPAKDPTVALLEQQNALLRQQMNDDVERFRQLQIQRPDLYGPVQRNYPAY